MNRGRVILLAPFLLVLCAGVVLGRLWTHLPLESRSPATQPSWLADQLDLRPDQRQQMDAIWADAKAKSAKSFEQRQALDRERDQTIQELLTPAEWTAYDKIVEDFRARRAALDKERHQVMADANEKSMALLDSTQKQKWAALRELHEHDWHGPHGTAGPTAQTPLDSSSIAGAEPATRPINP